MFTKNNTSGGKMREFLHKGVKIHREDIGLQTCGNDSAGVRDGIGLQTCGNNTAGVDQMRGLRENIRK